ncbi:MAG: hypothetical protein D6732_10765 [Methanobacteriota archaeon]|nr:MAG: hypothetical protein D6732_10765 [Euryarchaeota archaeon]
MQEELETYEQFKQASQVAETTLTAEQAVQVFRSLSILSTAFAVAFIILDITSYPVYYLFQTHVVLLMLTVAWYQIIRTRPVFQTNVYLQ